MKPGVQIFMCHPIQEEIGMVYVFFIAHDGVAYTGKMGPQLIGAAGNRF